MIDHLRVVPTVLCTVLFGSALASHAADIEAGKARAAAVCAACHGINGVSVANHIPNLAGQRTAYLGAQLRAFKSGARKHDVMNPIAKQLSAGDIDNLVEHYAAQTGTSGEARSEFMPNLTKTRVAIPADFPKGYTRYKANQNESAKTIGFFWANAIALEAARAGKPLPDGAVIVGETFAAQLGADMKPVLGADGKFVPGKLVSYSAMGREAGWGQDIPDLIRNDNWNYAVFTADRKARPNVSYAECFACHRAKEQDSFVFTLAQLAAQPAEKTEKK